MSYMDELCERLESYGISCIKNDFGVTWDYCNDPHTAIESLDGTLIVSGMKPEQVVAVETNKRMKRMIAESIERYKDENCGDCWGGICDECDCYLVDQLEELKSLGIEVK